MKYVIGAFTAGAEDPVLMEGEVGAKDEAYLRNGALPALVPVDADTYRRELAPILQTAARSSYVVDAERLYWLVEWDPGLLVLEAGSSGRLRMVALRSPIPEFGGREPLPRDRDLFEADPGIEDDNAQYRLVFRPWDAQFDEIDRQGYVPITDATRAVYEKRVAELNALGTGVDRAQFERRAGFGEGLRLDRDGHPVE